MLVVAGERGVPELMQGHAAGGLGEPRGGLLVAEPDVPVLVQVDCGKLDAGLPLGDEQRA